jgi:hypothetical protein
VNTHRSALSCDAEPSISGSSGCGSAPCSFTAAGRGTYTLRVVRVILCGVPMLVSGTSHQRRAQWSSSRSGPRERLLLDPYLLTSWRGETEGGNSARSPLLRPEIPTRTLTRPRVRLHARGLQIGVPQGRLHPGDWRPIDSAYVPMGTVTSISDGDLPELRNRLPSSACVTLLFSRGRTVDGPGRSGRYRRTVSRRRQWRNRCMVPLAGQTPICYEMDVQVLSCRRVGRGNMVSARPLSAH